MTISERRASYPLQERLKIYDPNSMAQRLDDLQKQPRKLVLHGVNVLNKNTLVNELSVLVPSSAENGGPKCHRAKILRYTIDYIRMIQEENNQLRQQLGLLSNK
ncbi:hypothetical protein RO3G_11251 [Rhizopus delemar RA 99-880]|uniref:BHLH domain-containing protein n=1 Tax=Rhizopus delemar (strain RA 99-880 / ATCC MYA-4621 / FGSC 9543 / NRRL 43880) TaxID=246409 RepID=I1CDL0_RHIO9|nr:hypothetical protein RO3G_11251 [Rhizopus delemar RA 99-880]|eukprot:EIE86540.1 hypothetical protein RO3G_11251 [Rhizopus delemar RA 99-880]